MPFLGPALPYVIAGLGAAGGALTGGSRSSSGASLMNLPRPQELYPSLTQDFLNMLAGKMPGAFEGLDRATRGDTSFLGGTFQPNLDQMMTTGAPVDFSKALEALTSARKRDLSYGREGLESSFGARGLRYSQPLMKALTDYNLQASRDLNSTAADFARTSGEGAATRRMQALGLHSTTQTGVADRSAMVSQFLAQLAAQPAFSYYPTAQVVGPSTNINQGMATAGGALAGLMPLLLKLLKP